MVPSEIRCVVARVFDVAGDLEVAVGAGGDEELAGDVGAGGGAAVDGVVGVSCVGSVLVGDAVGDAAVVGGAELLSVAGGGSGGSAHAVVTSPTAMTNAMTSADMARRCDIWDPLE